MPVESSNPGAPEPIRWILWAGMTGFSGPIRERFAAAAATGYHQVSVSPPELLRAAESGWATADVGHEARDLGLDVVVDPLMNWYPDHATSPSRFAGVSAEDALRVSEAVGAVSISAIATATSEVPVPALGEHFGRLCDRAADFGARVQLEFMPFTIVGSLRIAWDLVRSADRDNGGCLFDTWHFFRGEPDFDVLAGVPGDRIFNVQFDDAPAVPEADLRQETRRRLLPGDGAFDLARAIHALDEIGALRLVGAEVLNPELEKLPAEEVAQLGRDRLHAVLAATLGPAYLAR